MDVAGKVSINHFIIWFEEIRQEAMQAKKAAASDGKKRPRWTSPNKNRAIKEYFHKKGQGLDYRSRPVFEGINRAGEWLYDFVWRQIDDNDNLLEVVLTMEIELSDPYECEKKLDFYKLLQADSRFKIFVFQKKTENEIRDDMVRLKQAADRYRFRSNSEFLLCGWSTQDQKFYYSDFKVGPDTLLLDVIEVPTDAIAA